MPMPLTHHSVEVVTVGAGVGSFTPGGSFTPAGAPPNSTLVVRVTSTLSANDGGVGGGWR